MSTGRIKQVYETKKNGVTKLIVDGQEGYLQVNGEVSDYPKGAIVSYELSGESWGKTHGTSSCEVVQQEAAPAQQASSVVASGTAVKAAGFQPTDFELWKARQIARQASQKVAVEIVDRLLAAGAVTLPDAAAKKLKVYMEVYNRMVDTLTAQVFAEPTAVVPESKGVKKVAPEAVPAEDGESLDDEIPF